MEFIGFETEECLKHYGVKGMHWGIRRYQPYPDGKHGTFLKKRQAKKLVKTMNRNSYTYANAGYMRDKSLKRAKKYAEKGKEEKARKELEDAKFHRNTMEKAVNEVNRAIGVLDKGGYGVTSKSKNKMLVDKGRMIMGQLLFGPVGQVALAPKGQVMKYKAKEHPRFGMDENNKLYAKNKQAKQVHNQVRKHGGTLDLHTNKALEQLSKDPIVKKELDYKKTEERQYNKLIKEGKNVEDYLASPKSMDSQFGRTKMEKKIDSAKNSKELQKAGANYYISRNEADNHTGNVSKYYSLKADNDKKTFTKLLDEAGIKYKQKDIDVKYGPAYLYRYTTNKQRYIYDRY